MNEWAMVQVCIRVACLACDSAFSQKYANKKNHHSIRLLRVCLENPSINMCFIRATWQNGSNGVKPNQKDNNIIRNQHSSTVGIATHVSTIILVCFGDSGVNARSVSVGICKSGLTLILSVVILRHRICVVSPTTALQYFPWEFELSNYCYNNTHTPDFTNNSYQHFQSRQLS